MNKKLEKLMKDKSVTSSAAWIRLFDQTIASLRFPYKKKQLSSAEILNYFTDKNSSKRKEAAKSVGKVLKSNYLKFKEVPVSMDYPSKKNYSKIRPIIDWFIIANYWIKGIYDKSEL